MKISYMLIPAIAFMLLTGPEYARAAEVYTWLDDGGQVHFSDRAPLGKKTQTTDITPASGKAYPAGASGLRDAERQLLEASRRRESEVMQARQHFVSEHAARISRCRAARERYDRAKRKPGAANSPLVKDHYDEMRELCR